MRGIPSVRHMKPALFATALFVAVASLSLAPSIYSSGGAVSDKVLNDAAAYARSLAAAHKRNVEWPERAVRNSVSATAQEALLLGVIDLTANDVADLLSKLSLWTVHRA
jgi:membrane-bound serine protease (ClpP class)